MVISEGGGDCFFVGLYGIHFNDGHTDCNIYLRTFRCCVECGWGVWMGGVDGLGDDDDKQTPKQTK